MDRIREARRTTMAANGLSRRRHRSNSLRDSPEEDGPMELQEPSRLRDRGSGKKDRDRERDRDRDRERDRDRSSRSKRRRGDRLMHNNNREDGGDDSSEESVNDDEEDEDDDVGGGSVRMLPLNPSSLSSSSLPNHRKSFPPAKDFRTPPTWKAADEMIGVSVPRKARSASTKRLHECWALNGGIIGEQFHRQASTSPVRTSAAAMGIGPSPSPASPTSSNASGRKKMKPSGPKLRPPKSSSKSSAQDDIEIEIAEVLYGMGRQPQGISKQETSANDLLKSDSKDTNKSYGDGKSWVSSPISNSQSAPSLSSSVPPQNSRTSITIAAPKRKRPRHFKYEDENPTNFTARSSPMPSTTKAETDQPLKVETCSPSFDKNTGSALECGGISLDLANSEVVPASSEPQPESIKFESNISSDSKPVTEESERQDVGLSKEPKSPKKESTVPNLDDDREDVEAAKANPIMSGSGNVLEQKLKIDLMAPPPSSRPSPERDVDINAGKPKPLAADVELDANAMVKEDDKSLKMNKDEVVAEKTKHRAVVEEADTQKSSNTQKDMSMSLHLDIEKVDKDIGNGNMIGKRHQQHAQRQHQPPNAEIAVQSSYMPLPLSVPSWPGGLPPMGCMKPLQGVVSKDGATVSSAAIPPPHLLFNQPRPKRCATHCYIARTISYHQQLARMNPFWPAAAGSASLYGSKPCNLNVVPSTELQGNVVSRGSNSAQDKGHGLAMFTGPSGKEKGAQAVSMESAQRKQMLIQQALPPGAPSNILHGPAFIFPLNQQQAAAASVRPGSLKSLTPSGNVLSSSGTSNAIPESVSATGAAAAPTMSFSYPNMPGNETQYLAFLQNNAYPFTIPAHVGGSPAYRGTHAQALPFFNGSFYSSQMIHPSQLQQQQLPAQSQQSQQGHQNASMSGVSSSSQKYLQNQQQKPNASGSNGVVGLQGFPSSNNQSSQSLRLQQQQQQKQHISNHHASHPPRLESEMCGEDSPSTTDSRMSRGTMNIYSHNFAMPMQPPNFAMMTPAAIGGVGAATVANGINHSEKKPQQHTGTKAGIEASQAFAMSFASVNGATAATGIDLSSISQNHPILQSHNFQIMAAQAAQQKKNYRASEEGKTGDSSNPDDDRKAGVGKVTATAGQSIAFSRQDASDPSIAGNTVLDSSARTLNLGSAPSRTTASVMPASISTVTQQQIQQRSQQQQQPQIIQIQKHPQFSAGSAARSKTPSTSNGSVYSDHLPAASSVATKFTNSVSAYPQNLSQTSSTAAQSTQWKNSVRPTASQSLSSMAPTPSASVKTVPQQQARTQQAHTQISFAVNAKSSTATLGQPSVSTHSSSPQVTAASPTTSSVSKSAGSPRTTSTPTGNKVGQASSLSTQQTKNSQAVPSRKSSPGGGRNTPSVLSGPHLTTSSCSGMKPQLPQQQQPQQISKQTSQQAQLFLNAYMPPQGSQSSSSTSSTSAASGCYLQRRGLDPHMQRQSSPGSTSSGMLPLCPAVTIINASSADSSKVAAATGNNMKGGGLTTHGFLHPAHFAAAQSAGNHHQLVHTSFSYALPAAVQVKPADQKQPAGE